jgi:hypothetical protein
MVDREKVAAVLKRRFPGADATQVAAATNAIVGLDDEWVELSAALLAGSGKRPVLCEGSCYLADALGGGGEFRIFKRGGDGDAS